MLKKIITGILKYKGVIIFAMALLFAVSVVGTAGAEAVGLIIAESEAAIASGDDVTVQVKDIGLWIAGAAVNAGAMLMSDANGKAVTATAGKFILAQALEAATAAGQAIHVQIIKAGYVNPAS